MGFRTAAAPGGAEAGTGSPCQWTMGRRRYVASGRGERGWRIFLAVFAGAAAVSAVGVVVGTHRLFSGAGDGDGALILLLTALAVFLSAVSGLSVGITGRLRQRVEDPTRRLVLAMRRVRRGDLTFRVHMRRGDLLRGVAVELNELIDWMNEVVPEGVRKGGDVVEVGELEDAGEEEVDEPVAVEGGR